MYTPVIGLEVHVELATETKLFCPCSSTSDAAPNTQVCPVCLGLPGALPSLNERAVELALTAALALNCKINLVSSFCRKHYFYPDLPKGYQISQHRQPLAGPGSLEINGGGVSARTITLRGLHLEEDAGKSSHDFGETLLDFNRSGTALVEIVTAPVLASPAEARACMETLRSILIHIGVSPCRLEAGGMRCDANISLQSPGSSEPGIRTELKNLNSLHALERALTWEIRRQQELLSSGGTVISQTLRWDEAKSQVVPMRVKEQATDYLFLEEPDLQPLVIDQEILTKLKAQLPQLPLARQRRLQREHGLDACKAGLLVADPETAGWFDELVNAGADPSLAANLLLGDIARWRNESGQCLEALSTTPGELAVLLQLESKGMLSNSGARKVLAQMLSSGGNPQELMTAMGLEQISDRQVINAYVAQVISANPQAVADLQAGKDRALGYLAGQVIKLSQGRANPTLARKLLEEQLKL